MAKKKKQPEAEKENGERWLVSYADFMTLLLGLFIILYSKAAADAGGHDSPQVQAFLQGLSSVFSGTQNVLDGAGPSIIDLYSGSDSVSNSDIEEREMNMVKDEVESLASLYNFDDSIEVTVDETGTHIRIKDAVLFNSGSYILNPEARPLMIKIGDTLKRLTTNYIQIEGHTDNVPIHNGVIGSNWELGALRAVTVTRLFVENCAINPKQIAAVSFGEFQAPEGSNLTAEGRASNRRVDITILRNYPISIEEF